MLEASSWTQYSRWDLTRAEWEGENCLSQFAGHSPYGHISALMSYSSTRSPLLKGKLKPKDCIDMLLLITVMSYYRNRWEQYIQISHQKRLWWILEAAGKIRWRWDELAEQFNKGLLKGEETRRNKHSEGIFFQIYSHSVSQDCETEMVQKIIVKLFNALR